MNPSNLPLDESHGEVLLAWDVDEYPHFERSRAWYVIASILGTGLIVYAIATANFLFAVIVLMIGVILLVSSMKHPERVSVAITTTGILFDQYFHEYKELKDFSLVYEPPDAKWLYVDFKSSWQPLAAVPLEDVDPNKVRACLLPYCKEDLERTDERAIDMFRRNYKV